MLNAAFAIPTTALELRERAGAGLVHAPGGADFEPPATPLRGDHELNPDGYPGFGEPALFTVPRAAAVLVPIVARQEGMTVLLTQRPDHLPSHPGQIAFPGGKVEADDGSPLAAALRETEEEIGLDRAFVEVLGFLDTYQTATGFRICPVVALVRPGFELVLDPAEVAEAFEVPFGFLMDPANHRRHAREWRGRSRSYYAMPYGERYIWGATAGMLRNLYERLVSAC
jgi:8-oxo-dGTP pyrophosphatase MutT (NUDIX family)